MFSQLRLLIALFFCSSVAGCSLVLPEISHQPIIRNPFPQLSRVAIAPFFNHSDQPTVDGRQVAMAYYAELQSTAGFDVVPLGVVEEAIIANRVDLSSPGEARRLAQLLGVDAVVVGAVTDFSSYYPPRIGLRVEWYTSNPGYHEIPAGYGLPWNTPEEEFIPDELVYESQMALARAQMATQTPACDQTFQELPAPPVGVPAVGTWRRRFDPFENNDVRLTQKIEELPAGELVAMPADRTNDKHGTDESIVASESNGATSTLPPNWPDEKSFAPPAPQAVRPACVVHHGPVLRHTNLYHGTDPTLTQALKSYVYFRDDARFGGWESYLQRSDDFVRFCCHMHISEMLAARGGSRKTRLVWRWPESR